MEDLYTFTQQLGTAQRAAYFCGKMEGIACVLYDISAGGNIHGTHYVSVIQKDETEFRVTDLPITSEDTARRQFIDLEASLREKS